MWQVILIIIMSLKEGKLTSPSSEDSPAPTWRQKYSRHGGKQGGEREEKGRKTAAGFLMTFCTLE